MGSQLFLHMTGGKGEGSYANNSSIQRKIILKAKPILEETIARLYCDSSPKVLKVVDLGCSLGPNALLVTSNIIDIVHTISTRLNHEPPSFQFYMNDLFGNDFNTIFQSLPEFYKILEEKKGKKFGECFINATPGSFNGRLFPLNSINFFHSSNSIHWLSQDPFLGEGKSLNKGHCHIVRSSPPQVYNAYLKQFQEGFKLFLKSRSEELVPGGAMVLVFLTRDETPRTTIWEMFSLTLNDMLLEGLIEEEKLDSFNIPTYQPTVDEVRHLIQEEGSLTLQKMEVFTLPCDEGIVSEAGNGYSLDGNTIAEYVAKYTRSALEPLFVAKFGGQVTNEVFIRFQKKFVQLMEVEKLEYANLVISLMKNV